jgi:hypothetical protein
MSVVAMKKSAAEANDEINLYDVEPCPDITLWGEYRAEIILNFINAVLNDRAEMSEFTMLKGKNIEHMVIRSFLKRSVEEVVYDVEPFQYLTIDGEVVDET